VRWIRCIDQRGWVLVFAVTGAAATALTVVPCGIAQVTFNERSGRVAIFGNAEQDGISGGPYDEAPPKVTGDFAPLDLSDDASIGASFASSRAQLTQTLTIDPVSSFPLLAGNGSAAVLARVDPPVDGSDRASAFGQSVYEADFSLLASRAYRLSGSLDVRSQLPGSASVFFAPIVSVDPEEGYVFGPGILTDSAGPALQLRSFDTSGVLAPGRYLLRVAGSSSSQVDRQRADQGLFSLAGNAAFSFVLDFTTPSPPTGQVIRWINPIGGTFGDSLNWSPQQVPEKSATRDDTALFDLNNNYAVNIDSARTIERLVVRHGRVDFDNNILTVAATSPTVPSVSIENDGRLNIATGGLRSVHAIIGNAPPVDPANPPTAEVLVANINQGWQLTGNLAVGGAGKGRLFVANGGLVGSASATIGGPFGGEASVGGHASRWTTGNLAVGSGGNGKLNIEAGAEVESDSARVGDTSGSIGEVTVTGFDATDGSSSSWTTGILTVGRSGATGGLNILDGGVVSADGLVVADAIGAIGRVVVSGRNAGGIFQESRFLTAGGIFVGGNGDLAQMFVTDGGAVSSNLFLNIEQDGSLEITGPTSLVDVTGDVNVGTNINGLITFNGGRMIVGGTLTVGPGGELRGNGTLVAPNRSVSIGGSIDPGLSPGILTFDADYVQTTTGQLKIEIAGTSAGLFDLLEITGDATLGGKLQLAFINGFAPRAGDQFNFLNVGGALSGTFASIEVRNLAPGFQFEVRPVVGGLTMVALNDGIFVPEPATLVLLFAGMLATFFRRQVRCSV
jgi:T5SS/PEP-CTERM-associated repeat protein